MKFIHLRTIIITLLLQVTNSVRLYRLFQFIDGFRSEYNLKGFLHVGNNYAIFIRAPKPHDKHIIYELYEAKNIPNIEIYKPHMIAISKIPIEYIKEQLQVFRNELYKAKYVDANIVPGTQVQTLREWQIKRALTHPRNSKSLSNKIPILRMVL